jgi:hydroxypyruvate reductase
MTESCRQQANNLVRAALEAVDPVAAVKKALTLDKGTLIVGDRCYALDQIDQIVVVGGGKAALPMARATEEILGPHLTRGQVITKEGHLKGERPKMIRVVEAGHPVPDRSSIEHTAKMVELISTLTPRDLVICLISGGGSSLITLPASGIELSHLEHLNQCLLAAGAPIGAINSVRKHLSLIKGGQLAALSAPAKVVSLILSDVVRSPLDVIASGPTAPDSTTFESALSVLRSYQLLDHLPRPIVDHLEAGRSGQRTETLSPEDTRFAAVQNLIIGSNEVAAEAAFSEAKRMGFNSAILSTSIEGEACEVGRVFAALLEEEVTRGRPLSRPVCLIAGGETTVTLTSPDGKKPHVGRGGRNQELALSAALSLSGLDDLLLVALATDGNDGPTDAGGAVVDGATVARGAAKGLNARHHLDYHNAYPFFEELGDLLLLGPTGTNVNDLIFLMAW